MEKLSNLAQQSEFRWHLLRELKQSYGDSNWITDWLRLERTCGGCWVQHLLNQGHLELLGQDHGCPNKE